jgi:hypothetical protein
MLEGKNVFNQFLAIAATVCSFKACQGGYERTVSSYNPVFPFGKKMNVIFPFYSGNKDAYFGIITGHILMLYPTPEIIPAPNTFMNLPRRANAVHMTNILLADDHSIIRAAVKIIVENSITGAVVKETTDGDSVLKMVQVNSYDLLMLDITCPAWVLLN